jgi:TatD DNase family protein
MLIDSHCHPYMLEAYKNPADFDRWMSDTKAAGVDARLCVAVDMDTAKISLAIAEKYDDVYASVGSHPVKKKKMI